MIIHQELMMNKNMSNFYNLEKTGRLYVNNYFLIQIETYSQKRKYKNYIYKNDYLIYLFIIGRRTI